jgi:hypothetical protein
MNDKELKKLHVINCALEGRLYQEANFLHFQELLEEYEGIKIFRTESSRFGIRSQ